ncbi:hypothetical protein [Pseudoduganella chitinolytica]|uniref:Prolyl 4-hydroxylase alpha subunit Fe(2+) 2OG dioxygenase domain-containing protein n=1 Tax=Pseudoduganella chitinolytica TaxID=34070 RepID=A0ABY8B8X6_9BURK|nr:hypothetical protein [Pseudoduganella chitinolytica]WEF31438.1 hypothetical protein PX653_18480 [Pseudoduganella chitinolytica]
MSPFDSPRIVDDFFDSTEFESIACFFNDIDWRFGWGSNTAGESLRHWNKHFAGGGKSARTPCDVELAENINCGPVVDAWKSIKDKLLPGHSLLRCYANAHTFGLDGTIHRDNPKDIPAVTTILYCHRMWPLPWGGETVFYDVENSLIRSAVFSKPGRVVQFYGSEPHAAKSPSRVCRELRITLVFKSIHIDDLKKLDFFD